MPFNKSKNEIEVAPYSKLAYIYDDVMSHVDYSHWAKYIQKIIKKWHPAAHRVLDISCGTGSLLAKFDSKQFRRFGFDFSFDMINQATQKPDHAMRQVVLWCGNMKAFQVKQKMDVMVCLYDSINYLLTIDEWNHCFDCVFNNINDQGIFIFDICTEKNSLKYFRNYTEQKKLHQYKYLRESNYNSETSIHMNRFEIEFQSDPERYVEIHRQCIFPVKEVMSFISASKFEYLCGYDGFSFREAHKNSLRIHFILKKNNR